MATIYRLRSVETSDWRVFIEHVADSVEGLARVRPNGLSESGRQKMFGLAWQLKQVAREGTPSQGT